MRKHTNFEIIAGTYEEYLLGYIFSSEAKTLVQSFASHDHSSSIRCVATSDNYLASGASDDRIMIYDLKARKQHCMLTQHDSTITALAFTNNRSHVISASQDGSLAIVRVGNWQLEKFWAKAHKEGMVLDIALHSSGKLALTLGSDSTIHTWNLVKGRAAYIINLKTKCKDPKSLEKILFAPDSIHFVIFGGRYTEIWSIEIGGVIKVIEHNQKVTCCVWLDNEKLFVGCEDGNLSVFYLENEKRIDKLGHDGRVKAARYFEGFIVTASSSGEIKVWSQKLKELCKVATGCRITCLVITKWTVKQLEEEIEKDASTEDIPRIKSEESHVVIEVEESSSEESSKTIKAKRKRKKSKGFTESQNIKKKKSTNNSPDSKEMEFSSAISSKVVSKKKKKKKSNLSNIF